MGTDAQSHNSVAMYGLQETFDRVDGVVTDWNPRGFGFIMFSDGRRAYVHNSQCNGMHLHQGDQVSAIVGRDPVNPDKLSAHDVQLSFGAAGAELASPHVSPGARDTVAALQAAVRQVAGNAVGSIPAFDPASFDHTAFDTPFDTEQRIEGTVHEWNSRGFGFIHFADNKRAYVHNSACGGSHLEAGEKVSCLLTQDEKNPAKLMARDVQRLGQPPNTMATAVASLTGGAPQHYMAPPGGAGAVQHAAPGVDTGALQALLEGLLGSAGASQILLPADTAGEDGTVVEWHEAGGYGFLTMDDNRRAYIHRNTFGGVGSLSIGMRLRVKTAPDVLNAEKWCVETVIGQMPVGLEAAAVRAQTHTHAAATHTHVAAPPPMEAVSAEEDCVVTEWNLSGGYGFVLMDDKRRAYVHRNTFGGQGDLLVGMRLRVTTKPDPRNPGKWCVGEIVGELAGEPAPSRYAQGQAEGGVVAEWNLSGGYGFLNLDDGKRVYIHRNFFGGTGDLVAGQRLRVTTRPDPRNPGKFCVENVVSFEEGEPGAKRLRTF